MADQNRIYFIARFLARGALIGARRCSSAKRRAAFTSESLADSDPGHREARAGRVRQHDKLLLNTFNGDRKTAGKGISGKGWSRPLLLPDHAVLAAYSLDSDGTSNLNADDCRRVFRWSPHLSFHANIE